LQVKEEHELYTQIRTDFVRILLEASKERYDQMALLEMAKNGEAAGEAKKSRHLRENVADEAILNRMGGKGDGQEECHTDCLNSIWKCLNLTAAPSGFGANALAQAIVYRFSSGKIIHFLPVY
jgi:hypothetical protein